MAAFQAPQARTPHTLQNGSSANRYVQNNGRIAPFPPRIRGRWRPVLSRTGVDTGKTERKHCRSIATVPYPDFEEAPTLSSGCCGAFSVYDRNFRNQGIFRIPDLCGVIRNFFLHFVINGWSGLQTADCKNIFQSYRRQRHAENSLIPTF